MKSGDTPKYGCELTFYCVGLAIFLDESLAHPYLTVRVAGSVQGNSKAANRSFVWREETVLAQASKGKEKFRTVLRYLGH